MKCEICHQAEAVQPLTVTRDGETKELYVCHACAEAAKHPGKKAPKKPHGDLKMPQLTVLGKDKDPPPFVKDFVEATLGLMQGFAEEENSHRHCPTCKTSWEKIKESGRVGCPDCWQAFRREIRTEFMAPQYGRRHLGPPPPNVSAPPEASRRHLQRELKAAVEREDYHLAAELQKKLDALDSGKDAQT